MGLVPKTIAIAMAMGVLERGMKEDGDKFQRKTKIKDS